MTNPDSASPVTSDHAMQFGFIINIFAKIETQMEIAVAGMLNTDFATAIILMGDTHYRQKQTTLRNLNQTIGIDGYVNAGLIEILDDLQKLSLLRNRIAHSVWTVGRRPGSLKPMQLILRGKKPKPLGHHHNEKAYTVEDLRASANSLEDISRRFTALLSETGLTDRVEANIDKIKMSTDP